MFFLEPQEAFNLRYNDINKSFVFQGDLYISEGAYQLVRVNLIELDVIEYMNVLRYYTFSNLYNFSKTKFTRLKLSQSSFMRLHIHF